MKIKDILFVLSIFLFLILKLSLNSTGELSISTSIGGLSVFYPELLWFPIILYNAFIAKKRFLNPVSILIFSGLIISFLSCLGNQYHNWLLRFFIGIDFYWTGFLFCFIDFSKQQIKIIGLFLLACFLFLCTQNILISTGVVHISDIAVDYGGIIKFGTTAGSANQTGYVLLLLLAILLLIIKNRMFLIIVIIAGSISICFTLARGPILSLLAVSCAYGLLKFKKQRGKILFSVLFLLLFIFLLEKRYNFVSIMQQRNEVEDITSGRGERWEKTWEIYRHSSAVFGAGNGITPSSRAIYSDFEREPELVCSPHNVYLSFLVENGIFGIIVLVILLIVMSSNIIKRKGIKNYSSLIFLSCPLIMMNTEIVLRNGQVAFLFWFLYRLLVKQEDKKVINKK
jgi:O-antigen ligase